MLKTYSLQQFTGSHDRKLLVKLNKTNKKRQQGEGICRYHGFLGEDNMCVAKIYRVEKRNNVSSL